MLGTMAQDCNLPTWKAEIGRIVVSVQLGKKFMRPHINQRLGFLALDCHSTNRKREAQIGRLPSRQDPISKIPKQKGWQSDKW
jgi:hypothetical protein